MEEVRRDVRFALRSLARHRAFAASALVCLALAIGATSAVSAVFESVLLRPLPYDEPHRLVMVWGQMLAEDRTELPASGEEYRDYRDRLESLESTAAVVNRYFNLTGEGEPERLVGARVSASLFPILGAGAQVGRTFLAEEDRRGNEKVVLLSDGLWHRRFGGDPGVVGEAILLSGEPYTVVGVMPAGFEFKFERFQHELWVPVAIDWDALPPRDYRGLRVVGRLAEGVSLEQAQAEADALARRFQEEYPDVYAGGSGWGLRLVPMHEQIVGDVRPALTALVITVGLVFLIACANVANLFLARAADREKEGAIRASLGAARRDLARQHLVESLLLAGAGGVLGLWLASLSLRLLRVLDLEALPRLAEVDMGGGVVLLTLALAVVAGLAFGLVPAWRATRPELQGVLREGGKTDADGGAGGRLRRALVVGEVALALAVLVAAGLMARSLAQIQGEHPGFDADGVLTAQLHLAPSKHPQDHQQVAVAERIVQRVRSIPGVESAGLVLSLPLSNVQALLETEVEGAVLGDTEARPLFDFRPAGPGYFEALGIPLLAGRNFDGRDHADSAQVAIVCRELAARYWPGEDPLGKRLRFTSGRPRDRGWRTVVGVVGHVKATSLTERSPEQVYTPFAQSPHPYFAVALRTAGGDPAGLAPALREAVWSVDPDQPVEQVQSLEAILDEATASARGYTVLVALFGAVALVLAVVGVYGVMAYSVARRTGEIGLRLALGAAPGDVLALVVRQGALLAGAGLALGVVAAAWSGTVLGSLLHGVSARDPLTFAAVVLLLGGAAVVASWIPARRATRIDPVVALRAE